MRKTGAKEERLHEHTVTKEMKNMSDKVIK
jgi:hypothetical protein